MYEQQGVPDISTTQTRYPRHLGAQINAWGGGGPQRETVTGVWEGGRGDGGHSFSIAKDLIDIPHKNRV